MVIAEVKFQGPSEWHTFAEARRVREVYGISPLMAINHFTSRNKRWPASTRRYGPESRNRLHHSLVMMIDQANSNLQSLGLDIHISLVQHEDGFALDIYDCSSGRLCEMIGKEDISLAELPTLLKNLHGH